LRTLEDSGQKRTNVSIPEDLYEQIKEAIKGTGFSSVDDYVTYFLRIHVGKKPSQEDVNRDDSKVIDQLKSLGYL
jgi:Arc/MetJ-type ribon-helix-helix transcriptional regulator